MINSSSSNHDTPTRYLLVAEIGEEGALDANGAIRYYIYEGFPCTKIIGIVPKDYNLERLARSIHRKIYNQQYEGLLEYNNLITKAKREDRLKDALSLANRRAEVTAHMIDCVVYDHKLRRNPKFIPSNLVAEWIVRHPFNALTPWEEHCDYRYFLLKIIEVEVASDTEHFKANDVYDFDIESYMPL